jgi:glycosyltransferase involved in cell wall biosynthesis
MRALGQGVWQFVDSSTVGGIERHIATLGSALVAAGHHCDVVLYADHGKNPWLQQLARAGLPPHHLSGSLSSLVAALARRRPRLLHTHGYKAGVLGRVAARLTGVPVVSTFHAGERGPFPVNAYQALDAWSSWLGETIAVSEPIAAALPFRATVIPNFIAIPAAASANRPKRVAFVGRLSHEKGPDLFCRIAEASCPSIGFDIYGDGPMRSELEASHGRRVAFYGLRADMDEVWPAVGLLLMPSRAEGLPMSALEALAAGIPVAASAVGGLPGLVRNDRNGWLFPAGDIGAAAACVARWASLTEPCLATMAKDARDGVSTRFGPSEGLRAVLVAYARAGYQGPRPFPAAAPA